MYIGYTLTTTTSQTYQLPIAMASRAVFHFTSGAVTLAAGNSIVITHDEVPMAGTTFRLVWTGQYTLGSGASITFFGKKIGVATAPTSGDYPVAYASLPFTLTAIYNGTTYNVTITPTGAITAAHFLEGALDEGSIFIGNSSDAPTALVAKTSGNLLLGNGTTLVSVAMSGDITISAAGATTIAANAVGLTKLADYSLRGQIVKGGVAGAPEYLTLGSSAQFLISDGTDPDWVTMSGDVAVDAAGATTIQAGAVEVSMVENDLKYEIIPLLVSFEAAGGTTPSVGDFKIKMPFPGTVSEIYGYVVKAIAGTDAGTITAKNNAGTNMTSGVITCAISDARGTAYTVTPSADNTFVAGDILTFTSAKTTAGGLVQLSIKVTRS